MLNMLINILQPTHPDDIKSWLVYAPEKGTEFFLPFEILNLHVLRSGAIGGFLASSAKKKQETENSNERKFL